VKRKALLILVTIILIIISVSIVTSITTISDTQISTPIVEIKDLLFPRFAIFAFEYGSNHNIPKAFNESFIIQTNNISNDYAMEICFWETELEKMSLCINEGAPSRATTFYRSLQIVGEEKLPNNENFTLCEGYNYIDCNTSTTGADLGVEDDIETKGSIYSNEHITIKDFLRLESVSDKGDCNSSTHGNIVYELDNELLGTHYACRQKKDGIGYEWKPLY
jgi:hypothetical protein